MSLTAEDKRISRLLEESEVAAYGLKPEHGAHGMAMAMLVTCTVVAAFCAGFIAGIIW